ncbi:restriction endonuclease subunit S [Candidatus Bathyarchaeota archaeon]|nr:restriction endonuclease subunit S [Candidatus Bathyarchaeota archaeon]
MTEFLDIFKPIQKGNFGLTDEAIYRSIQHGGQFIPVYGGTKEHTTTDRFVSEYGKTKYDGSITIFTGDGIIISLDGSSGCMTYVMAKRFALNHHAGFFQLKEDAKQVIDPEFFSLFFEKQLQEASVSEGSKTLTLSMIESMDFDMPPYSVQMKVMSRIRSLLKVKERVNNLISRINSVKERILLVEYRDYQAKDVSVGDVLDCMSGNSGLTEEYLYSQIKDNSEKKYHILTASTEHELSQYVSRCKHPKDSSKMITVVEGKPVIHVVRIGKAGSVTYFENGDYTTTENAYLLYLKDNLKYDLSLKWLTYALAPEFSEYSNIAEYGTWNMTGFFERVKIAIPSYEEQLELVEKYERLELLQAKLQSILTKIDQLFTKQIVI